MLIAIKMISFINVDLMTIITADNVMSIFLQRR